MKTEPKHTPGPWRVQPDPKFVGGHVLHQNRFITCGLPDMTSDEWLHDGGSYIICSMRDCQNQEANAALIARAPSLLADNTKLRAFVSLLANNQLERIDQADWFSLKAMARGVLEETK